ncbi:MAG: hypothetical protein PHI28_11120, partial [Mangrovibacterium sp.]|nr:hypothetical protein [Mangrovibacterium sp.]
RNQKPASKYIKKQPSQLPITQGSRKDGTIFPRQVVTSQIDAEMPGKSLPGNASPYPRSYLGG